MGKGFETPQKVIFVCVGSKCKKRGGKDISKLFRSQIKNFDLEGRVEVIRTECTDRCDFAPVMSFQPGNVWFHQVSESQARQLFQDQILTPPEKQNPPNPEV